VDPDSIGLDVERNVLTVRARRPARSSDEEVVAAERPRGVSAVAGALREPPDLDEGFGDVPQEWFDAVVAAIVDALPEADPPGPGPQGQAPVTIHASERSRRTSVTSRASMNAPAKEIHSHTSPARPVGPDHRTASASGA